MKRLVVLFPEAVSIPAHNFAREASVCFVWQNTGVSFTNNFDIEIKNRKAAVHEIPLISEDRKLVSLGRISDIFYNTAESYLRYIGTKIVCCLTALFVHFRREWIAGHCKMCT